MRVLIVSTWYPSAASPVTGSFVRSDATLLARRHDVEVLHLAPPGTSPALDDGSAPPVTRLRMATNDPRDIVRVGQGLRARLEGFDVVHTHAFSTLLPFLGRSIDIPWVHTEHWTGIAEPATLGRPERLALALTGHLLNRPDVVVTVSEDLRAAVQRFRRREIRVIPPAVPRAAVVPAPATTDEVRLVAVGGLVSRKDPLLATDIVRELRRRGVPARMEWVGDGPLHREVEARAGEGFSLLGALDRTGVGEALDRADVFLLPTRRETLCLGALEAITHGRPVVMGAQGGQREYVTTANGRLVARQTAAAYADAVESVLAQRPAADAVARTIGDRFAPETVLAAYERAYARARARKG